MNFEDLTPEQMEKAKACTNAEELVALAKEEGYELTDAELETVSGGETRWLCTYDGDCFGAVHSDPDKTCTNYQCEYYSGKGW